MKTKIGYESLFQWSKGRIFFAYSILFLTLTVILHAITATPLFTPSPYNTYTLQALAWRQGQAFLPLDIPHLELAIYKGNFYVSFPPVPSLPIYLLTFLIGDQIPDGLLVKIYALIGLYSICSLLARHGFTYSKAAFWAFLMTLSSSILPMLLTGAVWYQAQVLAFCLTACAFYLLDCGNPTAGLLCYALSVGCRPFNALYGPLIVFLFFYKSIRCGFSFPQILKKLIPGLILGFLVAALYAWYNYIRFENPLEFGHNFLPEFSFQGGTQFSLQHVKANIIKFVFGLPFAKIGNQLVISKFGFSLFLANPVLILLLFWFVTDLLHRQASLINVIIFSFMTLHLFLLLLHRTFGGFQYGARYAVDLIPYVFIYLIFSSQPTSKLKNTSLLLSLAGLLFAIYGSTVILV